MLNIVLHRVGNSPSMSIYVVHEATPQPFFSLLEI
jgi:hypothetical protein